MKLPFSQLPSHITAARPRALVITPLLPRSVTVTPKPANVIENVFLNTVSKVKAGKNPKVLHYAILIALHNIMI